ncbi:MAG TPA: c-type cytochrome [Stellaceae bacterium]|jgi:cytochrome c2
MTGSKAAKFATGAAAIVVVVAGCLAAGAAAGVLDIPLFGKNNQDEQEAQGLTGGDVKRGRTAIRNYGCGTCHTIPGVAEARGLVGPPLDHLANRVYIAGVLTNTPENLIDWIQQPRRVDRQTAMPNVGVTEDDARDIAAYLYTLK